MKGWIGVDLDGTLAKTYWGNGVKFDAGKIGEPVPRMVEKVKALLAAGATVKIFTARVYVPPQPENIHDLIAMENWIARRNEAENARIAINMFTAKEFGQVLEITCTKDYGMYQCFDDRAQQVVPNEGIVIEEYLDHDALQKVLASAEETGADSQVEGSPSTTEHVNEQIPTGTASTGEANTDGAEVRAE